MLWSYDLDIDFNVIFHFKPNFHIPLYSIDLPNLLILQSYHLSFNTIIFEVPYRLAFNQGCDVGLP